MTFRGKNRALIIKIDAEAVFKVSDRAMDGLELTQILILMRFLANFTGDRAAAGSADIKGKIPMMKMTSQSSQYSGGLVI